MKKRVIYKANMILGILLTSFAAFFIAGTTGEDQSRSVMFFIVSAMLIFQSVILKGSISEDDK